MEKPTRLNWRSPSFLQQLALTFTIGICCLSLLSSMAISTLSYRVVRERLIEQGYKATETFAEQSTLALLYGSQENAEQPSWAALAFPDVRGVAIYAADRAPLLAKGEPAAPASGDLPWPQQPQLGAETAENWYFVAPVFAHRPTGDEPSPFVATPQEAKLIGYVRLVMGKDTLKTMDASVMRTNLGVSGAFALVFLVVLLTITRRITKPLKHLADIMGRASAGAKNVRARMQGPTDIVDMEAAFNTMMEVLETREGQLETARDAALESARLKGEFAANVSHELRTPLNAVLGMLELLQDMGLTTKQAEYVGVAYHAGEALLKLIEDILDFSRIEAGMMKLQPVDFALHEVLDEVVGLLAGQARRKGLELAYNIDDAVPTDLCGEAARIRQVLVNLTGNAIKYTEHGSIDIRVAREQAAKDTLQLRFEVADSGVGIPPEARRRIFEAFVQVDGSSTRRHEGAGLGLAICRQLVELMGGEIGVDSEPGNGSRFWFSVPLAPPSGLPARLSGQAYLASLRVLIVSDGGKSQRFLAQMLGRWEIAHDHAEHGPNALEMLRAAAVRSEPYQFAIIDKAALGQQGVGLVRVMAHDPLLAQVKVILLGNPGDDELADPDTPNVVSRLDKPAQASLLYDCILSAAKAPQEALRRLPAKHQPAVYLGCRILVVEDNRASQQVAIGMLERLGCRTDVAGTGKECLESVARRPYDLVLMDCHMPQMDGFEATRQIRALESGVAHIPIVAMTANAQQGDSALCLAAGMDDYLPKPLRLDGLREKLQYWLVGEDRHKPASAGAPTPTDAGPQPLDGELLRQLQEEIGDAFPHMVEFFLEDCPGQIHAMQHAVAAGDAATLSELAHSLKGASRNLGANGMGEIAKQLEDLCRSGSLGEAAAPVAALSREFGLVKAALEREAEAGSDSRDGEDEAAPLVLVADDDRAMRFALYDVLRKDGYRIEQAATGTQALAACQRKMPDLVLLDAMMPELDGFALCSRLRQHPEAANTPILIVTALDDERSIDQAFAVGATDYIPKPVHFAVLRQRVARLLDASRAEEHLNRLAYQDLLTGLPNRAQFMERLQGVLAQASQCKPMHAILFLDLDRFKLTNDTMGHEIGDLLLKAAAERIQRSVRAGDLVSRFGGDEFTLLLENIVTPEVAAAVAEKICQAIAQPFSLMDRELYISSSIGISVYPADGTDSGILIKHADAAMYRAKERGNTYRFYEESMELAVATKLRLESDLRRALERGELFLHYQPQVELRGGKIIGMEALLRWRHPELGLIPPLQFIPLAEETGLIETIGEWVLKEACRQNKAWQRAGLPAIPVAVNLSARQFEREGIIASVIDILAETGLEARYLELELTESMLMREPDKTRAILDRWRTAGILISIDDFGTGYSSLSHLKHFPFDKLKIDKSFVSDLITDADDAAIVLTIIAIARTFKLRVIAEGVETEEQLQYLKNSGCDEMQGYYFSMPVTADEAARLLADKRFLSASAEAFGDSRQPAFQANPA